MRKLSIVCFLMILCGALALAADKDKSEAREKNAHASAKDNEKIARQVFDEVFSQGRFDLADQLYHKDFVVHHERENRESQFQEALEEAQEWRQAAPDLKMTADKLIAQGDTVIVQWSARGTNTGSGRGVPATGKRFLIHGTSKFLFVDGKIKEAWLNWDENELRKQLGVPPKKR